MADISKIQPFGSSTQYELGARYLTTARTLTIGGTGKTFNGTANISWSKAEILGSSSSANFYRGDQAWSNTLGGAFTANGTITANSGYLISTLNNNTVTIGSANSSFCHFQNSANIPFYFNHYLRAVDSIGVYNTNTYMSANVVHCANGNPDGNSMGHGIELRHDGEGGNITFYSGNCGSYGSYQWEMDAYNGNLRWYNFDSSGNYHGSVYIGKTDGVLHGACWNDYAEFRETCQEVKPGQCVIENGDDTLSLSTKRCQPGAQIVSDTYGFAIGEVEGKYETPLAVSGRVLAYTDVDRYKFKPGQAVCSGPNGTVSHMRWYEKILWPERMIGFVSAIPKYKEWGNINAEVKVNNRIWIKVR